MTALSGVTAGERVSPSLQRRQLLAAALSGLSLCSGIAQAQDTTPLRIIVPTPPGGTNDGVARALQAPLQRFLGKTVIVEYKAGAAGSLGSEQLLAMGVSPTFLGPEAFSKRVEQETQRWGDIVRERKLQKERWMAARSVPPSFE